MELMSFLFVFFLYSSNIASCRHVWIRQQAWAFRISHFIWQRREFDRLFFSCSELWMWRENRIVSQIVWLSSVCMLLHCLSWIDDDDNDDDMYMTSLQVVDKYISPVLGITICSMHKTQTKTIKTTSIFIPL